MNLFHLNLAQQNESESGKPYIVISVNKAGGNYNSAIVS